MSISISCALSRSSGMRPLAVYFNGWTSTSTLQTRPQRSMHRYDFDDPDGGSTYAYGAQRSKNTAHGSPGAAHCFNNVGSFSPIHTQFDGFDVAQEVLSVTVTDPDSVISSGNTLVVSHDGDFTGAPAGTQLTSTDWDSIVNTTAGGGATYQRIRAKKGGTYTASAGWTIDADGPGIVDAWGSGAKPIVSGAFTCTLGNSSNFDFGDWRFSGIRFDGVSDSATAVAPAGGAARMTWHDCEIVNWNLMWSMVEGILDGQNGGGFVVPLWSEWAFVDSICPLDAGNIYAIGAVCLKIMILGSQIADASTAHSVRIGFTQHCVISDSEIGEGGLSSLTIRGHNFSSPGTTIDLDPAIDPAGPYTEYVTVTGCKLIASAVGGGGAGVPMNVRNVTPGDGARMRYIIVEDTQLVASTTCQDMLSSEAEEFTVRNCHFNVTGFSNNRCITLAKDSGTPSPANNIDIYNNTVFGSGSGPSFGGSVPNFMLVAIGSGAVTNLSVKNNLICIDGWVNPVAVVDGTPGSGYDESNNSTPAQMNGTSAGSLFVSATPTVVPTDFALVSGAYAIGAGIAAHAWVDYSDVSRYNASAQDLGFLQYLDDGEYPWLTSDIGPVTPMVPRSSMRIWSYAR